MQIIKLSVTKNDLAKYEKHFEKIADYPIYASTSGICKADGILISKILDYEFGNNTELEITIKIKE